MTKIENETISQALIYWSNYIETGDLNLCSSDLQNMKMPAKHLSMEQMKKIIELRELARKVINDEEN